MLTLLATLIPAANAAPPIGRVGIHMPDAPTVELRVKFKDEARARMAGPALTVAAPFAATDIAALSARWGLEFSPLIRVEPAKIEALRARAQRRTGIPAADLQGLYVVRVPDTAPVDLLTLAHALEALPAVEYAHIAGSGWPPPGDIDPETDDYSGFQDWQGPDPGVDTRYALSRGVRGASISLADCEYDWNANHEDLVDVDLGREKKQTSPSKTEEYGWDQHGTAAVGAIVAGDNGYGATGAAPDTLITTWPEESLQEGDRRVTAIAGAVANALAGDVVMLEMQAIERPGGDYGPAELDPDVFEVVRTATDAGVIVVAAAGNGAEDLDGSWYQDNWLDWGDSGAILVGAGDTTKRHVTLYFSSYGSRVNVQGWGEDMFTLGYGDAYEIGRDIDQAYTYFSGTSSATPVVAAAVVLIQDFLVSRGASPLGPLEMRELLVNTGVAKFSGDPIGPIPDVAAALLTFDGDEDDSLNAESGGDDCDDADPRVHPGSDEPESPDFDANCDGEVPEPEEEEAAIACGCSTGVSAGAWLVVAGAGLALRRRARR